MQRQLFLKLYKEKAEKINVPFSTDMGIDPSRDDLEGFDHESQYNSVSGKSLPCASESNVTDKNTEKKKKSVPNQCEFLRERQKYYYRIYHFVIGKTP